jgi:hypothetical protein
LSAYFKLVNLGSLAKDDMVQFLFDRHQSTVVVVALPEFSSLPSVIFLLSVFYRALSKEAPCRVPRKKPSVKENTRRRNSLPSVLFLTLGKEFFCRVSFFYTRQRALCQVSQVQHSAKSSLPSVFSPTLAKTI